MTAHVFSDDKGPKLVTISGNAGIPVYAQAIVVQGDALDIVVKQKR
jgi:hypothetical protein